MLIPISAKIKIRQFNFDLTLNALICKRKWFISMLTIVFWGNLRINKVGVYFLRKLDLKTRNKTWVQLYQFSINGFTHQGPGKKLNQNNNFASTNKLT